MCIAGYASTSDAQAGDAEARLRAERMELERMRRERDSIQARLRTLERSSRDMAAQAKNLEAQANLTARVVGTYNRRLHSMNEDVDSASGSLVRAQDDLLLKQATMRRRLIAIYKRGPLYSFEALLSAQSFGDLVARYKYLRTVAQDDRARVLRMEELRTQVEGKRDLLVVLKNELALSRDEQAEEERRLRSLEDQMQRRAASTNQSAAVLQRQIQKFLADSARFANTIAAIEAERRRDGRAGTPIATGRPVASADRGRLEWPVDGDLIYSFGRLKNPNNTVIRWDGVGIAAPIGTPVKAVADGVVALAGQLGGYGTCVILGHGNDYSIYCSLSRVSVALGQNVTKGQQVGVVGVNDPELGPHLHFQIRVNTRPSTEDPVAKAIDPLEWLRDRR
jgi:septal ring factor EnvC (AmiA/AmiB activator)